jgi:hypothetical protein
MVLRSINRLILQSGSGGYGILIDASNKVFVNSGILNINAAEWSSEMQQTERSVGWC